MTRPWNWLDFPASAADHLPPTASMGLAHGLLTGGTLGPDGEKIIDVVPTEGQFFELQIYKPSDATPHIESSCVRMLVPLGGPSAALQ